MVFRVAGESPSQAVAVKPDTSTALGSGRPQARADCRSNAPHDEVSLVPVRMSPFAVRSVVMVTRTDPRMRGIHIEQVMLYSGCSAAGHDTLPIQAQATALVLLVAEFSWI